MSERIVLSKSSKFRIIPIDPPTQVRRMQVCDWCHKNPDYTDNMGVVGTDHICIDCHTTLRDASQEMYLALCEAYRALNTIPRQKIGSTDSYAIASQVGTAINHATVGY